MNNAVTPHDSVFISSFMVSSSQDSSMGWNPPKKRKELFDKRSRFILAEKQIDSEDLDQKSAPRPQTTVSLRAFGMFRFDTEHDAEGEDEEVIYWLVGPFSSHSIASPMHSSLVTRCRSLPKLDRKV